MTCHRAQGQTLWQCYVAFDLERDNPDRQLPNDIRSILYVTITGPYHVERRVNQVNYVIRRSPRAKPFICHIDRMRKFVGDLPMHSKRMLENIPVQNIHERQRNVPLPENVPTPNVPPPANNVSTPSGNIPRRKQPTRNKRRPVHFM